MSEKMKLSHRAVAASALTLVLAGGTFTTAIADEGKGGKGERGQSGSRPQASGQSSSKPAQAREGQQNRPTATPSSTRRPESPPPSQPRQGQGGQPTPHPGQGSPNNGGNGGGGGGTGGGGGGDTQDPGGNNGTFKVDGQPFDTNTSNEPHIECGPFRLVFFGFDEGQRGTITINGQPPSGTALVSQRTDVLISDDAAGGGPNDLDAIVTYTIDDLDLSQLTAHPQQGYHLKVTLTTTEGPKHKVFWLEGCETPTPTATVTPTEDETIVPTTPPATIETTPPATVGGVTIVKPGTKVDGKKTDTSVLGTKFFREATSAKVLGKGLVRGASLAVTGAFTGILMTLAAALLALGGGFLLWSRRAQGKHAA